VFWGGDRGDVAKQIVPLDRKDSSVVVDHLRAEVQEVLDQITRELAPHYYNKAILDVQAHLKDRFESIESDLWALEKS
jgi:uncharacterized protein (DUF2164 family)